MALGIRVSQVGLDSTWVLVRSDPLLWIIMTAPVFLGAFAMLGGRQHDQVRHFSVGLEKLVDERTQELASRNAAMRVVLDNVQQGLATIRADGTLDAERSVVFDDWFKSANSEAAPEFHKVLAANDNRVGAMLELGWESLQDGFLPRQMAAEQMPRRLLVEGRHYQLSYRPIGSEEEFEGALLMVDDITDKLARRKTEQEQREMLHVFQSVMRDRNGFISFFNDTQKHIEAVARGSLELNSERRAVHTIKGNCAISGVETVASLCHQLEEASLDESRGLNSNERTSLQLSWDTFADRVRTLSGDATENVLEVERLELESILQLTQERHPYPVIAQRLLELRNEPVRVRLERIARQAEQIAIKLGKLPPQCEIAHHGLRLPAGLWEDFWSAYIHVVRNALDHGIEGEEERSRLGKPSRGNISLEAKKEGDSILIVMKDDGRGIDWQKIAEKRETRDCLTNRTMSWWQSSSLTASARLMWSVTCPDAESECRLSVKQREPWEERCASTRRRIRAPRSKSVSPKQGT